MRDTSAPRSPTRTTDPRPQKTCAARPKESLGGAGPETPSGNSRPPPRSSARLFPATRRGLTAGAGRVGAGGMDSSALPRLAKAPSPGVLGPGAARRRPASPELLRCSRQRRRPGAVEAPGGGVAAVARRNERERNRVKLVNLGFQALRQHVPLGGASKKLSKVETLRSAVEYIRALQRLLAEHDALRTARAPAPRGPPAPPSCASSSPRSACSSDDSGCERALSPADRELLDFSSWLGGC